MCCAGKYVYSVSVLPQHAFWLITHSKWRSIWREKRKKIVAECQENWSFQRLVDSFWTTWKLLFKWFLSISFSLSCVLPRVEWKLSVCGSYCIHSVCFVSLWDKSIKILVKKQTKQTLTLHFYILVGLRILYFPNEISGKTVDELSMIRYKAGCLLQIWCHTLHQPEKQKNICRLLITNFSVMNQA